MVYLLIDTCIWKKLVDKVQFNQKLYTLQSWVNSRQVKLLCPTILKTEWKKHRDIEIRNINKRIAARRKQIETEQNYASHMGALKDDLGFALLKGQIDVIDEMFENSIEIQWTEAVSVLGFNALKNKKAPFFERQNSAADAEMIFSTLLFLKQDGVNDFYFVTDNHNDFADIKDGVYYLHPDISGLFPTINIIYMDSYDNFNSHLICNKNFTEKIIIRESIDEVDFKLNINEHLGVKGQIAALLKHFKDVNFIPLPYIINNYPFVSNEAGYSHYSGFTLKTRNKDLFEGINELISSKQTNTESLSIVERIGSNLIYFIANDSNDTLDLCPSNHNEDFSIKGKIEHFKLLEAYRELQECKDFDHPDWEALAYCFFYFGEFDKAGKLFSNSLANHKPSERSSFSYSIIASNLLLLKNVRDSKVSLELVSTLDDKLKSIYPYTDKLFMEYLKGYDYYHHTLNSMTAVLKKITEHLERYLQNGWSYNNSLREIICYFAQLDLLTSKNNIIFHHYSEMTAASSILFEALFICHSYGTKGLRLLEAFDDYFLNRMVHLGNPKELLRFAKKYGLNEITYYRQDKNYFIRDVNSFFDDFEKNYIDIHEMSKSNHVLNDVHNRMFDNILVVLSLLDIDQDFVPVITKKMVSFIRGNSLLYLTSYDYLSEFVSKKGKFMNSENLTSLLELYFEDRNLGQFTYHSLLCHIIEQLNVKITIDLLNYFNVTNAMQIGLIRNERIRLLMIASRVISDKTITSKLSATVEETDELELIYWALMYDIPVSKTKEEHYFRLALERQINRYAHSDDFYGRLNSLGNEMINIAFMKGYELNSERFQPLAQLSEYFNWLLNIGTYDYSKFQFEWLFYYFNVNYKKEFSKHPQLKLKVFEILANNRNIKGAETAFGMFKDIEN